MMIKGMHKLLFLIIALLSVNLKSCPAHDVQPLILPHGSIGPDIVEEAISPIEEFKEDPPFPPAGPGYEPCEDDPYYEENRQELADEIDNVNAYMERVADELANDGVIVVRAVKKSLDDTMAQEIHKDNNLILMGAGDFTPIGAKEFVSTPLSPMPEKRESPYEAENKMKYDSSSDEAMQSSCDATKSSVEAEPESKNVELNDWQKPIRLTVRLT